VILYNWNVHNGWQLKDLFYSPVTFLTTLHAIISAFNFLYMCTTACPRELGSLTILIFLSIYTEEKKRGEKNAIKNNTITLTVFMKQ